MGLFVGTDMSWHTGSLENGGTNNDYVLLTLSRSEVRPCLYSLTNVNRFLEQLLAHNVIMLFPVCKRVEDKQTDRRIL